MTHPARSLPLGLQVAPSLLAADFTRLGEEIRSVEACGVRMLHLDVMDGHFVPNITFGPPLVASIRRATELFLDTHLMIRQPLALMEAFARSGADLLTLHAEALGDPGTEPGRRAIAGALERARGVLAQQGCGLGISFKPATDPMALLEEIGGLLDLLLIMTVEPGFGGQAFLTGQLERVSAARRLREERGWRYRIEVDGGLGEATAAPAITAGAEILVAGTAVFGAPDRAAAVAGILAAGLPGGRVSA